MDHVLAEHQNQMAFTGDQDPVQEFPSGTRCRDALGRQVRHRPLSVLVHAGRFRAGPPGQATAASRVLARTQITSPNHD